MSYSDAHEIHGYIKNTKAIVGHNIKQDLHTLKLQFLQHKVELKCWPKDVDIATLAMDKNYQSKENGLGSLAKLVGERQKEKHDAVQDA